jgi:hypothetical protein
MARDEQPDERAMVAHDKEAVASALEKLRRKSKKTEGDRQIEERLEYMARAGDLDDPQRYHGS